MFDILNKYQIWHDKEDYLTKLITTVQNKCFSLGYGGTNIYIYIYTHTHIHTYTHTHTHTHIYIYIYIYIYISDREIDVNMSVKSAV